MVTPMIVRMMPAIGRSGMKGQRIMRTRLIMAPTMMSRLPAKRSINREQNPTKRETRRSKNIWNLRSMEELALAVSAEIWR